MATKPTQTATVTGPVTGGKFGWPFAASLQDVAQLGYIEEEYFLAGSAKRYRDINDSLSRRDGHWQAEEAGEAPFKTRMIVYRPADPARFNGTVILNWNNVTAGYDLFNAESMEIFAGGYALVCLTPQKAGIEGLTPLRQGLAQWDPERYGDLSIVSDDYSFDIFTQGALATGPDRRGDTDPLGGLDVKRVIAWGASQSAGRLCTYINAIAPLTSALDGYILAIYFGRGTPLEVGETVVNINEPQTSSPQDRLKGNNLIRDDLKVPVFVINSELESMACYGVRQEDSDTFRYWESAGTCHVSEQTHAIRKQLRDRDQIKGREAAANTNRIPMNPLYDAVFWHMQRWVAEGIAPPSQPKVAFSGEPAQIVRDDHGIATGGIRLPQVEVPTATNSAIPRGTDVIAFLDGSSEPFSAEKLLALYGSEANFIDQFETAAQQAVEAGVLLPRDVPLLVEEARQQWQAQT
ncbi:MAG: hypothetical protein KDI36_16435 [Pseudomonadales bacterium]|nr:hypothetical protein [Pseudomonadales bacterium]